MRQAERVGRVRFLRRNDSAARPLIAAIAARKRYRANNAVAVDHGRPHIEIEPAVRRGPRSGESGLKLGVRRHISAGSSGPRRGSDGHSDEHKSGDKPSFAVHLSLLPPSGGVFLTKREV